jgi:tetracycline repressor-like protein
MRHVGDPGGQHPVDHREVIEHFQAAWAQSLTAGTARELRHPIDDAHRDATPGKITRERQAGRADTAISLFLAHGFDRVSVNDIAAAAEVSKPTLFRYFATKEDLVLHRFADHKGEAACVTASPASRR